VAQLLEKIGDESGYASWLRDGTEEGEDRWNNLLELRSVATAYDEFPSEIRLSAFLEEVALVSDQDEVEQEKDRVTLLTLHTAKGLEFPVVFVVGLEENILPHSRSMEDADGMEEERRLMYVGATRAKDRLYLVYAFRRMLYGRSQLNEPSRFLKDILSLVSKSKPARTPGRETPSPGYAGAPRRVPTAPDVQAAPVQPERFVLVSGVRATAEPSGPKRHRRKPDIPTRTRASVQARRPRGSRVIRTGHRAALAAQRRG
jgi:DNA helicase-2/ATP-dependent DNA helicase PcrA